MCMCGPVCLCVCMCVCACVCVHLCVHVRVCLLSITLCYFHAAVDCGQLPPPKDGSVSVVGTSLGSKAFYKCGLGFDMVGAADRTCGANGAWSGDAPLCQRELLALNGM